jgi:Na+/proline symporter
MHALDYTIIVIYLLAIVAVGLLMEKRASRNIDSYFLGGRRLPWWMLGVSGMASNLDVTGTMINTALVFVLGISGFFIEIRGGVVLILALLMIFVGKWIRRSKVMTFAEWMRFRFGKGKQGDAARLFASIGTLILAVAMVTYFATGAGKFVAEFLGIPDMLGLPGKFWAALFMIVLAMIYTVSSGFYGVIMTDLVQAVVILGAIVYVCYLAFTQYTLPETFAVSVPMTDGTFQSLATTKSLWTQLIPSWRQHFPAESGYAIFNLFGVAIMFYLFKVIIEGSSGCHGYMPQRYFAAKNDRECGLLTMFWTFLLAFRWPFIAAIAVMGIVYSQTQARIADPEMVLPVVIGNMIPVGLKGFLVAGLMSAAMSTFDSTINAAASYWVKDIYGAYLNPKASEKQLVRQSRLASIMIVAGGLLLSLTVQNINQIWGFITMGVMIGMLVPMVMRWFWWRMNGYGFAIGTGAGMVAAFFQEKYFPLWPEYYSFLFVAAVSFISVIVVSLAAQPTEEKVLVEFYKQTRPFGFWGPIRRHFTDEALQKIRKENRRDIFSVFFALPWQVAMFLLGMTAVLKKWTYFGWLAFIFVALSAVLYFSWFRYLGKEVSAYEVVERRVGKKLEEQEDIGEKEAALVMTYS